METHNLRCTTTTTEVPGFVDLTEEIQAALEGVAISDGRITIFSPDRSCAILVNERESGLIEDLKGAIARFPTGASEAAPALGSPSVVLPVSGGRLQLGTWQRVLLVEMGRPGERSVTVQIVGER